MTMTVACCGADGTRARRVLGLSHDHVWPNLTARPPATSDQLSDRIVGAYPTIPRSDDNKDAVIRPGTLRFPYAQTAERAPISCLFLGDRRLGEGRTISLPRSTLTGAAAKPTAPPIPGRRRVPDDAVARSSICHPFRGRRSILRVRRPLSRRLRRT